MGKEDEVPPLVGFGSAQDTESEGWAGERVPLTIITEFGDSADIEKALTISQNGEKVQEWLELANGCICCSIKDTGLASIESLIATRGGFDYILLETSGLADPGNVAPLFWTDEGLGSNIYLDGIVTLVDAKNILTSLDEPVQSSEENEDEIEREGHPGEHLTTAHLQISHADVIVVNKADTVTPEQLDAVVERIKSINGLAKIHITQYSQVPQLETFLLDLHAYDGVQSLEGVERGHSHMDPTISTIALPLPVLSSSQLVALEAWLRLLLWENTLLLSLPSLAATLEQASLNDPTELTERPPTLPSFTIHRTKGLIHLEDGLTKMLQGVREVFEITDLEGDRNDASAEGGKKGKIVLIGRGLKKEDMEASLARALREVGD